MAQRVDASFNLSDNDGRGISFRSNESSKLVAVLPALSEGAVRNLLIVAESNVEDNSGTGSGFLYPVFHTKIKVVNENTGFFLSNSNGSQAGYYGNGFISQSIVIDFHPDKEKYMRYVKYGHADCFDPNKNYLETEGLSPGQYKIIYVFGETFEKAWSYATADFQYHSPTPQKIVTIMDITILSSD